MTIKKMAVLLGTFSLALSGCGTAVTVLQDDEAAARGLRKQKPTASPSLASTAVWPTTFCLLHAPPDPTGVLVPFVLLDLTLSGALDTVALPYTIYRQATDGNIRIYWRPGRG